MSSLTDRPFGALPSCAVREHPAVSVLSISEAHTRMPVPMLLRSHCTDYMRCIERDLALDGQHVLHTGNRMYRDEVWSQGWS